MGSLLLLLLLLLILLLLQHAPIVALLVRKLLVLRIITEVALLLLIWLLVLGLSLLLMPSLVRLRVGRLPKHPLPWVGLISNILLADHGLEPVDFALERLLRWLLLQNALVG